MGLRKALINTASLAVAFETMDHLVGVRIGRRMEADRRAQLLRFAPDRIVVAVVNMAAVGRLRNQA